MFLRIGLILKLLYPFCQHQDEIKMGKKHPYGLLNPLPVPDRRWSDISMDFIQSMPVTTQRKYDTIPVVVDRLTEMSHFTPCHPTTSAEQWKISPYYANYGFNPKMDFLVNPSADALANDAAADNAHALEAILKELKSQMSEAQESYSRFAN
ncbi:hypothetical protein SeMB42_g02186 [Synchytrium endobioticum]|uniref:Uncharacterized protein n=1 Tax=Synchytrium endobioticum TaxID=286115 RepID=A0A507DG48_9FUNG|nr:hypothetical protein SeMB42_g02186 [Synchytrium endobioticum]